MTASFDQEATARETKTPFFVGLAAVVLFGMFSAGSVAAQTPAPPPASPPPGTAPPPLTAMTCSSALGERTQCAADTSAGVVLVRSTGAAPCLLGRTWG